MYYRYRRSIESEADKIKNRIDNLDYAEINILVYINLLNSKIKELILNINRYYEHHKKKMKKKKKSSYW